MEEWKQKIKVFVTWEGFATWFCKFVRRQLSVKRLFIHLVDVGFVILLACIPYIGYKPALLYGGIYLAAFLVVSVRKTWVQLLTEVHPAYKKKKRTKDKGCSR